MGVRGPEEGKTKTVSVSRKQSARLTTSVGGVSAQKGFDEPGMRGEVWVDPEGVGGIRPAKPKVLFFVDFPV